MIRLGDWTRVISGGAAVSMIIVQIQSAATCGPGDPASSRYQDTCIMALQSAEGLTSLSRLRPVSGLYCGAGGSCQAARLISLLKMSDS